MLTKLIVLPMAALLASVSPQIPPRAAAATPAPAPPPERGETAAPLRFDDPELVLGSPSAPATVVEYFSNTCAHCAAFDRDTFPYVEDRYIRTGQVRFIFREIPTAPTELSGMGFIIARCAGRDKYLSVSRDMFQNQEALFKTADIRPILISIGVRAGLSVDQMQVCLDDDAAYERLNARIKAAVAAGVEGTPSFVINGRMLRAGDRLGGSTYGGGELTRRQFDAALQAAEPQEQTRSFRSRRKLR